MVRCSVGGSSPRDGKEGGRRVPDLRLTSEMTMHSADLAPLAERTIIVWLNPREESKAQRAPCSSIWCEHSTARHMSRAASMSCVVCAPAAEFDRCVADRRVDEYVGDADGRAAASGERGERVDRDAEAHLDAEQARHLPAKGKGRGGGWGEGEGEE
jgi:hypothetical protein